MVTTGLCEQRPHIHVSGNTRKQQRTLRSTILSTYLIGIVGAGDQTEESCQRVRRWIRDFPHLEQVHKSTCTQMIYTALCVMLLMRAASITLGKREGVGPWKSRGHFTGPKKVSISRAQTPPTCPRNV
jgi:hypothetical protein